MHIDILWSHIIKHILLKMYSTSTTRFIDTHTMHTYSTKYSRKSHSKLPGDTQFKQLLGGSKFLLILRISLILLKQLFLYYNIFNNKFLLGFNFSKFVFSTAVINFGTKGIGFCELHICPFKKFLSFFTFFSFKFNPSPPEAGWPLDRETWK